MRSRSHPCRLIHRTAPRAHAPCAHCGRRRRGLTRSSSAAVPRSSLADGPSPTHATMRPMARFAATLLSLLFSAAPLLNAECLSICDGSGSTRASTSSAHEGHAGHHDASIPPDPGRSGDSRRCTHDHSGFVTAGPSAASGRTILLASVVPQTQSFESAFWIPSGRTAPCDSPPASRARLVRSPLRI
jgi:hypothetical protein